MSVSRHSFDLLRALAALLVAACASLSGCAQLRVPAIDPTGNYIFSGNSTTLDVPHPADFAPTPAFRAAKTPGPCLGPHCAARPCGNVPGAASPVMQLDRKPYVVVMPGRVVAPVGSEVIVASGICGGEGNYVMRQPLEWTVSPDSVGHIVQVGKNEHCFLTDWLHANETQKLSADRAYTRTFSGRQTVDRGTDNPADDVVLGKGQSWVSVTSPVEGATFVNVVAPTVKNWEKRRQTATVYWVDGQWMFPTPQIVRVDKPQPAELVTTVARTGMNAPIEGWLVRYEVLDGPPATFEGNGQPIIEVPTDVNGQAVARVVPTGSTPGTTQIGVQVIRPSNRPGDVPRMVVGQGSTSVTWSAPGLGIRAVGPSAVNYGEPATYLAEVVNVGDMDAKDVVISYTIPPGTEVLSSNPPAQPFGDRIEWRLGDIRPREVPKAVEVTTRMTVDAQVQHLFRARSTDGLAAEDAVQTLVNRSALVVRMNELRQVPVGTEVRWMAEIENTGLVPLTNVTLSDAFDDGLEHITGRPSPITLNVGTLAPGERFATPLTFIVRKEGRQCHRLEARSDDRQKTSVERCVTGSGERSVPRVSLSLDGPETVDEGGIAEYMMTVKNTGNVRLTNVKSTFQPGSSLQLSAASQGKKLGGRNNPEVYWDLPELDIGESQTFRIQCRALRADPEAFSRADVTSDQANASQQFATTIVGIRDPGGVAPDMGAGAGRDGTISLTANPINNPAAVGQKATINIQIQNNDNVEHQDVTTLINVPQGMRILDVRAPFQIDRDPNAETDNQIGFALASLPAGERTKSIQLDVVAEAEGLYPITIESRSANDATGTARTIDLEVVP